MEEEYLNLDPLFTTGNQNTCYVDDSNSSKSSPPLMDMSSVLSMSKEEDNEDENNIPAKRKGNYIDEVPKKKQKKLKSKFLMADDMNEGILNKAQCSKLLKKQTTQTRYKLPCEENLLNVLVPLKKKSKHPIRCKRKRRSISSKQTKMNKKLNERQGKYNASIIQRSRAASTKKLNSQRRKHSVSSKPKKEYCKPETLTFFLIRKCKKILRLFTRVVSSDYLHEIKTRLEKEDYEYFNKKMKNFKPTLFMNNFKHFEVMMNKFLINQELLSEFGKTNFGLGSAGERAEQKLKISCKNPTERTYVSNFANKLDNKVSKSFGEHITCTSTENLIDEQSKDFTSYSKECLRDLFQKSIFRKFMKEFIRYLFTSDKVELVKQIKYQCCNDFAIEGRECKQECDEIWNIKFPSFCLKILEI